MIPQVSLDIPDKKILKKMSDIIARGWLSEGIYTKNIWRSCENWIPHKIFPVPNAH